MTNENKKNSPHKYGIVLYGATSFVGQLVAAYLQKFLTEGSADNEVSWAIAGRNQQKLEQVRDQVGNKELPLIIADSEDADSLNAMAAQAQVIISTVGPYLKYGEPLIIPVWLS